MIRHHPRPQLFPYTTLFRSDIESDAVAGNARHRLVARHTVRRATDHDDELHLVIGAALGFPDRDALARANQRAGRSEEHTSELQSLRHLVCRLLLEKKKNTQ